MKFTNASESAVAPQTLQRRGNPRKTESRMVPSDMRTGKAFILHSGVYLRGIEHTTDLCHAAPKYRAP